MSGLVSPQTDLWRKMNGLTPARIKACREELGLGQQGFAELIGRHAGRGQSPSVFTVSRWERGVKQVGILWGPTLLRLVEESEARRAKAKAGEHRA